MKLGVNGVMATGFRVSEQILNIYANEAN